MDFSLDDKVILCSMDLSGNPQALLDQKNYAAELANVFTTGNEFAARDLWKASHYKKLAGLDETPPGPCLVRTKTFYVASRLFSYSRSIVYLLNRAFHFVSQPLAIRLFQVGGLSFGVQLLFDIAVTIHSTFLVSYPVEEYQSSIARSIWQRFTNVMLKDGRLNRMIFSALLCILNLLGFFLTGGFFILINLAGFLFDLVNKACKTYADAGKFKQVLNKIDHDLNQYQHELHHLAAVPRDETVRLRMDEVKCKINKLKFIKFKTSEKINGIKFFRSVFTLSTLLIATGISLLFVSGGWIAGTMLILVSLGLYTINTLHSEEWKKFVNQVHHSKTYSEGKEKLTSSYTKYCRKFFSKTYQNQEIKHQTVTSDPHLNDATPLNWMQKQETNDTAFENSKITYKKCS